MNLPLPHDHAGLMKEKNMEHYTRRRVLKAGSLGLGAQATRRAEPAQRQRRRRPAPCPPRLHRHWLRPGPKRCT